MPAQDDAPSTSTAAIVGGTLVPEGSEVARRTVLFTVAEGDGTHGCTATVLDATHALTAAHCVFGVSVDEGLVLVFATRWSAGAPKRAVTSFRTYDSGLDNDIAVLTFAGGLPEGSLPVTLPDEHLALPSGTAVVHAGYGRTSADSDGSDRGVLRSTPGLVLGNNAAMHRLTFSSPGHTVCNGDSGGPDFLPADGRWVQIGVHVTGDCVGSAASTDVRAYLRWIHDQLGAGPRP
jgi:secreted trypsin-like serine protease